MCVVLFTQLVTLRSALLRLCMKLYTVFRSLLYHKMFVNFRCRMYCIYNIGKCNGLRSTAVHHSLNLHPPIIQVAQRVIRLETNPHTSFSWTSSMSDSKLLELHSATYLIIPFPVAPLQSSEAVLCDRSSSCGAACWSSEEGSAIASCRENSLHTHPAVPPHLPSHPQADNPRSQTCFVEVSLSSPSCRWTWK